jgi:hypothetical protein
MKRLPELGMLAHAVAVAADRDQVAVVDEAIDECGGRRGEPRERPDVLYLFCT